MSRLLALTEGVNGMGTTSASTFSGSVDLLIMPSCDAVYSLDNTATMFDQQAAVVGPLLSGLARSAQVLMESATSRALVNMTAFTCVEALYGKTGAQLSLAQIRFA